MQDESVRECVHDPITTGDWCFRGLCRHCGHDCLAEDATAALKAKEQQP